MIAKFEYTGSHMQHGYLKVRVDLYPEVGDACYSTHYIWNEELQQYVVTPCLCHFIKVNSDTSFSSLQSYVEQIFDTQTVSDLDDFLYAGNIVGVRNLMNNRLGNGSTDNELPPAEMGDLLIADILLDEPDDETKLNCLVDDLHDRFLELEISL